MTPSHTVNSVLSYFERFERAARLQNHRAEYQHFEQCWLTVHQAFYGSFRIARPLAASATSSSPVPEKSKTQPEWFARKYGRPLRRVIDHKVKGGRTFLVLGCEHLKECHTPEDAARKHARCGQCKGAA